ncbi:hypothetical protein ACLB2K_028639 [Fragaria x ananassa]
MLASSEIFYNCCHCHYSKVDILVRKPLTAFKLVLFKSCWGPNDYCSLSFSVFVLAASKPMRSEIHFPFLTMCQNGQKRKRFSFFLNCKDTAKDPTQRQQFLTTTHRHHSNPKLKSLEKKIHHSWLQLTVYFLG